MTLKPNSQSTHQDANVGSFMKQSPSDHSEMRLYPSPAESDLNGHKFNPGKIMSMDDFDPHDVFQTKYETPSSGRENEYGDDEDEDDENDDGSCQ